MPRRKRSYLPGGAFHITARTHNGEFWFDDLRNELADIIAMGFGRTDASLLAFGIMTNHFHLIVRQGNAPLSQLMHPICQRAAYAVHRRFKRKGYVMGYRYFDTPCRDESHLRTAIMYTHRNPVEAGMCKEAWEYRWSTDAAYREATVTVPKIAAFRPAVELFASGLPDRTVQQDYADFYAWYDACKKLGPDELLPRAPGVTPGDGYWLRNFEVQPQTEHHILPDLRDVVLRALAVLAPGMTLEQLRTTGYSKSSAALRDAVIEWALRAGHRPVHIARFLNTSDSTVSRVNVRLAGRQDS
jgi:REP element-mobilizing transposase RayT